MGNIGNNFAYIWTVKRNKCIVEDCSYPRWAKGYCSFHQQLRTDKKVKVKIPKQSEKMIEKLKVYAEKRDKYLKEHPVCEVCEVKNATEVHHMRGRTGALLTDERYFLSVDRDCHRRIENNPSWGKENGYSLNRL